ncbi:hypothetical protein [Halochromatium sp.]
MIALVWSPGQATAAGPDVRAETRADAELPFGATAQAPPLADQIRVEADTAISKAFVGQQILLRVLVIGDGPLPPGRLIPPSIDGAELLILSDDRRIDYTTGDVSNDGKLNESQLNESQLNDSQLNGSTQNDGSGRILSARWVYERRYALFPRSAGQLEIPPSVFSVWRPAAAGPEELRSAALTLEVMPAQPPPAGTTQDSAWLPAKQLSLSEAGANVVRLAPGQVVERMLTLKAVGLRAEDLPPIAAPIPFPLAVREDAPRLWNEREPSGVTGYRTERITISSAEPGLYRLPAISIDWWNVEAGHWERASTPEWQLRVADFDSSSRRPAPDWRRDWGADAAASDQDASPTTPEPKQPWLVAHWPWIIVSIGLLLVVWQRRRLFQMIQRRGE